MSPQGVGLQQHLDSGQLEIVQAADLGLTGPDLIGAVQAGGKAVDSRDLFIWWVC